MKNQKPRKYSTEWYQNFPCDDTRFYGLFLKGKQTELQTVSVDMKRFCEYFGIEDERKTLRSSKNNPLFKPVQSNASNYNINVVKDKIFRIKKEWVQSQKVFINQFLSEIKGHKFTPLEDDNFRMGYGDFDDAVINAHTKTFLSNQYAEYIQKKLYYSLYAQYYHQLAAQMDSVILRLLTDNGYAEDYYNREVLLTFKDANKESSIKNCDTYKHYEKMYVLWNFIKHNSNSTYNKVKEFLPEVLIDKEYKQGDLACYFIHFSSKLIEETIDGMGQFLVQYCEIVFEEDEKTAEWNYDDFFRSHVRNEIDQYNDPLGLAVEFY